MSGADLFRPRRRPLLRLVLALSGAAVVLCTAAIIAWLRINVVPPDCSDPRTLALVRQSLLGRFKLPPAVTIDTIRTLAGGYVAFRFSCLASLDNIDRNALAPGTPIPDPLPLALKYVQASFGKDGLFRLNRFGWLRGPIFA